MHAPLPDPFRLFWSKGYHDLLPVIPANATGVSSPGKCPGVLMSDGRWQGRDRKDFKGVTEAQLEEWHRWGAGVGIRCNSGVIAVDIDSLSEEWSQKILDVVFQFLGASAVRVGQWPKRMIVFRASVATKYRQIRFQDGVNEKGALVELLAGPNCWFVAHGVHPKTGELYRWPDGVPECNALTYATAEKLEELFDELKAVLPASKLSGSGSGAAVDQSKLVGDPVRVTEAMEAFRNDPERIGYNEWIQVAAALHGSLPDNEGLGEELFVRWSEKAGIVNPQCPPHKYFWSVNPPYRLGAVYLFDRARETGWAQERHTEAVDKTIGEHWFDPTDWEASSGPQQAAGAASASAGASGPGSAYTSPFDFATASPPRRKFDFKPVAELAQRSFDAKPPALIEDLLRPGEFSVLVGKPKQGKTFVVMHMMHCIARGAPFADRKTTEGLCVYIGLEGGTGINDRLAALIVKHGDPGENFQALSTRLDLRRPNTDTQPLIEALEELSKRLGKPIAFVVVDTFFRALSGGDENSGVDVGAVTGHADLIRARLGCHFCFVHHFGKDASRGMRGHSSQLGDLDTQIGVADGRIVALDQRNLPQNFDVGFTLEPFTYGSIGEAPDERILSSCVVKIDTTSKGKGKGGRPPTQWEQMVLDALKQLGSANLTDLYIHLQIDGQNDSAERKALRNALWYLLKKKYLVEKDAKGNYTVKSNVFE